MAETKSLKVRLLGSDADKGLVRLNDFSKMCADLWKCLKEVERSISDESPHILYRIIGLECQSAAIEVEPISSRGNPLSKEVVDTFISTVENLQKGQRIDHRLTPRALKSFRDLYKPIARKSLIPYTATRLEISGISISESFLANIAKALETPLKSEGSVSGRLDKINVHTRNEFSIFPSIGTAHVVCIFNDELLESVRASVKRHVTVHGTMYYQADHPYPVNAVAKSIEIHPANDDLPRLSDLRGSWKTSSDKRTSVEIVRAIRDEY